MGAGFRIKAKANSAAEIFIYEDVGESWFGGVTAKQFAEDLKSLGNVTSIDLRINSAGGDVFDGLTIYRRLVDHKAKITTHIDGLAASIASVIAMAGDEIRISESGFLMIHKAWAVSVGTSDDMRTMADILDKTNVSIMDVYKARTNNSVDKLQNWMDAETWFSSAEAIENNFADAVDANMQIAARLDNSKHKFKHAPAALIERPNATALKQRLAQMRAKMERRRAA